MRNTFMLSLAFVLVVLGLLTTSQPASAGPNSQEDIIAHGRYIATIAGCTTCHTPLRAEFQNPQTLTLDQIKTIAFDENDAFDISKFLAGGRAFDLGPAGIVYTRNITPDDTTGIGSWTDEQVKIAIKTGIDANGKTLFPVMPYHVYNGMADADLDAVVAFLGSVNAINYKVPDKTVNTEGLPTPPYTSGIAAPDPSDKAARGAYIVNSIGGCTDCHTPVDPATGAPLMDKYLAGRQPYDGPWGTVYGGNITPDLETGLGDWTEEEIKRAVISGVSKDGRRLILMPWFAYAAMTPEDADAVAYYLKNELTPVNNQIPPAALNPDFVVVAPEAFAQEKDPLTEFLGSPTFWMGSVLVLALIAGAIWFMVNRRQPQ